MTPTRCSDHITPRHLHSMPLFVTPAVQFLHREPPYHRPIPPSISRPASRYCISLAASNATRFSFGFGAISTTLLCSPGEAALFRGAQGCVRLLKNVTALHLAALHGADQVSSFCRAAASLSAHAREFVWLSQGDDDQPMWFTCPLTGRLHADEARRVLRAGSLRCLCRFCG